MHAHDARSKKKTVSVIPVILKWDQRKAQAIQLRRNSTIDLHHHPR